ncbi:MAG: hypothetical protein GAK43_00921 [Stenotrophomonas maltophilia]|nr:MAG: hypothetical protein GAK43_00921 [Stenotrophomonas maltophilia]
MKMPAGFDRYLALAERFLARGRVPLLLLAVARKSGRLKLAKADLRLLQELTVAVVRGQYRGLDPKALLAVVGALLYFVAPLDLIPDWLPGVGFLDDLAVLAWVVRHWQFELDAFKRWRDEQSPAQRQALALLPAPAKPVKDA